MKLTPKEIESLLSQCENEPIQIPGLVQPHGILLTLRASDLTILQISESVFDLLGVHYSEFLHQPLSKLMDTAPVDRAMKRLGDRTPRLLNPIPIEITTHGSTKRFDGILHRSGRVLILELEIHVSEDRGYGGFGGFYEAIREVTSRMMVTENLGEVLELACQELRKLTGFSRVLAYRFDADWNGQVVNESKEDEVPTLLHHRFPASDIPKQARELYTTNWLRLIPNVDYRPSPIHPNINPITDKPLDLSNSVLRSVSPVHLEYMRNMGQVASMSVSLLKGRKLWGLISCHNAKPLYLKYDVRVAAEFIGQMVSAQIVAREDSSEIDHKLQLKKLYDDLLRYGGGYQGIAHAFALNASSLLGLVDAAGAALCFEGRFVCVGATPANKELMAIHEWVTHQNKAVVHSDSITEIPNSLMKISSVATGVLAVNIVQDRGDCIIWFRPEQREQTKWAGDPNATKLLAQDGRIHPRKSFETWYESTAGTSRKWRAVEIEAAEELQAAIKAMSIGYSHGSGQPTEEEKFRNSLSNSIATSNAMKGQRPASSGAGTEGLDLVAAAQNSTLLLEGFSEFAVLFLDLKGRILSWSSGAKNLIGYDVSAVLGESLQMFFSEEDVLKSKHDRLFEHVLRHKRCEEELWLYRADQTSFWAKLMVAQVCDSQNKVVGYTAVIQDVTKEKSAEEELKAMKATAETANRAKSAFLANISHEIRTPLGAVLGFSELMSAPDLPNEDKIALYSKVRRNGEQLTILINDLLDISKVESGKIDIETLKIDLKAFLHDCEQLFILKASEHGVKLKFEVEGELPATIESDPTRLRQVVINLLSNAIKFTPSGGSVTLKCSLDSNAYTHILTFRIIDTGRGMTEVEMEKLFQPFVQADVSTTREYGGTGLGLFLSQRLARALGGDLSIEWSKPGGGSCFVAMINPGTVSANERFSTLEDYAPEVAQLSLSNKDLSGVKILVVDDSIDNRELIKTYLVKAGAEVQAAENGEKGIDKALKDEFDIVLMDVQMPVLDGNEAMRILKQKGFNKPVIALTAHAMRAERDYSIALGFEDYLTKPIDRALLIDRIREIARPKMKA